MRHDLERDTDGAASAVGADDRSDLADHDLAGCVRPQHLDELVDVAAVGVEHGEVLDGTVVALHLVDEEVERLRPGALLAALLDDAAGDLDDRLDRQRGGEQRLGVADPAALLQVLERVERTEDPGALDQVDRRPLRPRRSTRRRVRGGRRRGRSCRARA